MANVLIITKKKSVPPEAIIRFQGGLTFLDVDASKYTVIFDASASNDPDGSISTYIWSRRINGGNWTTLDSTTTPSYSRVVNSTAIYDYRVEVIDNDNNSTISSTIQLNFTRLPSTNPIANINGQPNTTSVSVPLNQPYILDSSQTYPGTEGDVIIAQTWERQNGLASIISFPNDEVTTFVPISVGTHIVELEVVNDAGLTDTNTINITAS